MNRLVGLTAFAVLFAASAASAQEPPSLRAAPDPGAVAQENRDIAGRWFGAGDAAMQSLAKSGGTLTNIVTGKFSGLSNTIAIADASAALGAASAGDVRGAVSGAAAIAVGGQVTAGGAALFGEVGAVAGGAIGSFFPVIGNIAGSIVGGAVGTAAGGFIAAFGYDKYVKDYVARGVTGIVSVFDKAPLAEAMEAKRAYLWATMAPEERAQLQGFRPEEVTLLDFGTLPYVPVLKQPVPDAQQQVALPPVGGLLAGVKKIVLDGPTPCVIDSERITCTPPATPVGPGLSLVSHTLSGVVAGNILELELRRVLTQSGCTLTDQGHIQVALEAGGRAHFKQTTTLIVSGCAQSMTRADNFSAIGTWRVLE